MGNTHAQCAVAALNTHDHIVTGLSVTDRTKHPGTSRCPVSADVAVLSPFPRARKSPVVNGRERKNYTHVFVSSDSFALLGDKRAATSVQCLPDRRINKTTVNNKITDRHPHNRFNRADSYSPSWGTGGKPRRSCGD